MENKTRHVRKRKSAQNELDKGVKKQCNVTNKRDGQQRQTATDKHEKQNKSTADEKAKPTVNDVRKVTKKGVQCGNRMIQTRRRTRKQVELNTMHVTGTTNTNTRSCLKRTTARAKQTESKDKKDNVPPGHSLKNEVDLFKNKSQYDNTTNMIVKDSKTENDTFVKDKKTLQAERDKLRDELQQSKVELEKWKSTAMANKVETEKLQQDRIKMEKEINELSCKNAHELKEWSKKLIKIERKAQESETELKKTISESEDHLNIERAKNNQLEIDIRLLSQKNDNLQAKMQNVNKDNENKSSNEIAELKQIDEPEPKAARFRGCLYNKIKESEAKILDLTRDLKRFKECGFEADKTHRSIHLDHKELQGTFDTPKQELEQFKSIKTIQVQMLHCSGTSLVSKISDDLTALLKKEMENEVTKLEFIECGSNATIDPRTSLLVICISASRLGTDAQNAIKTIHVTSKMALLIFHHKEEHALPQQASSHVLTGQEFKQLGGIFDFGFLSSKGIYPCSLNDHNLKCLVNFIRLVDLEGPNLFKMFI